MFMTNNNFIRRILVRLVIPECFTDNNFVGNIIYMVGFKITIFDKVLLVLWRL